MTLRSVGLVLAALTLYPAAAHSQPDLVGSVTSVTPSPVTAGSSISIGWKVTNQGTSAAGASGLKLYLSSNPTLDASDLYLTPAVNVSNVNAGGSSSGTVSRTVPAGTALGTWYILAQADAFNAVAEGANEGNNVGAARAFTVGACSSPGAFNPSSPLNNSSQPSATTALSLSWSSSAGATSYDVYFGSTSSPPLLANQTGTSRTVNVAAGNTYFWKVVAKSSCGSTSAPVSGTWSFSVAAPPTCSSRGTFGLTSPSNGAGFPSSTTSVSLVWGAASGAGSYDLYFGPGTNPSLLGSQSGTSRTVSVTAGQTYSWKVVAEDSCGQPATSAGPWSFTVAQPSGSLVVTVQDQNGTPRPGAKVVRYPHASATAIDTVTTDATGRTPAYANLPPGTSYDFEAYYEGADPFDSLGELWATATATATSGAGSLTLRRDWPYVESLRVFRVVDGMELTGPSEIFAGDEIRMEAAVRNPGSSDRSTSVRFALDRDRVSPWDLDQPSGAVVVPAGSARTVTAEGTVLQGGTYLKAVRTEVTPGGKTDAWDWVPGFLLNPQRTIDFAGKPWEVRSGLSQPENPGSNYWSPSRESVWKDEAGRLHLKLVRKGDHWVCSEVISQDAFGYGTYTFRIDLPTFGFVDDYRSVMVGLFNYLNNGGEPIDPAEGDGEIDIELGRWRGLVARSLEYVVHQKDGNDCEPATATPPDPAKTCKTENLSNLPAQLTFRFRWASDGVDFEAFAGHSSQPLESDRLSLGRVTQGIPTPGGERVHMNFWLADAVPPAGVDALEIVVTDFEFEPAVIVGPPPADPSWLRVTVGSQARLDLQWDDNSADESGFKVERKDGCCGPWTEIATLAAGTTTYPSTGLACGTTYAYRVWAFNGAGPSGKTNEANATTAACSSVTVPAPDPSWLRVSAVSPTRIDLQWDDNSANEDGFKVERKEGCCGPWTEVATLPANTTSYQSTGLTCGLTYAYRVWAFNAQGSSGKTNEAATGTPDC